MATLTIGEGGDIAWTPASITAAGYPGIGLRAQYNSFTATDDTIFQYKFAGNAADWQAGTAGSVIDSGPLGLDATPIGAYAMPVETGEEWINQSCHIPLNPWRDPHGMVITPTAGVTIPQADPFTLQWWMKINSLSRNGNGGIYSIGCGEIGCGAGILCYITAYNTLVIQCSHDHWYLTAGGRGRFELPVGNLTDGKWHQLRFVNAHYPGNTTGLDRRMYYDGVLQRQYTTADASVWSHDWVMPGDHIIAHYNWLGCGDDRPYRWEAGIDADFDDFLMQKADLTDAVSRWKYDGSTATGCSAVQAVDLGVTSTISGVTWSEVTASSDERLQSIEIDDGLGYQTVWTYGGAVDVSGLAPAAAYNIRLTQYHSTDTVHEFAHILQSLTLEYEAAGGYRRPPLVYRMGPKIWQGGLI